MVLLLARIVSRARQRGRFCLGAAKEERKVRDGTRVQVKAAAAEKEAEAKAVIAAATAVSEAAAAAAAAALTVNQSTENPVPWPAQHTQAHRAPPPPGRQSGAQIR